MKKILILSLMFAFSFLGLNAVILPAAATAIATGTIVKGEGLSTLYYIGEDGRRYVFPNDKTYFSWYADFSGITVVPQEDLYAYPLGGNVRYKPGRLMIKIQTDPKVYAVGQNGQLHWIKTENLAKKLYGSNWNLMIDDVPDSFFTNYAVSDALDEENDFDPIEEEDEIPTPSYNLGFKTRLQKQSGETFEEKRCLRLEALIARVQNRLVRFGLNADQIGDDYFDECFDSDPDEGDDSEQSKNRYRWHRAGKIDICHDSADGSAPFTINVSLNAAPAHLAHGDTLGACGSGSDDDEELAISSLLVSNITATGATVTWNTNLDSDSLVIYNISGEEATSTEEKSALTQSHSITLGSLATGTTYSLTARSTAGSETAEKEISFSTLAEPDTTAPTVSDPVAATSSASAVITWNTNEAATGKVYYADNENLTAAEEQAETGGYKTAHSVEITGLATSTAYFFYVESEDEAGNSATSTVDSFTTGI